MVRWAEADVDQFSDELKGINGDIKAVAKKIVEAGGPYVQGISID